MFMRVDRLITELPPPAAADPNAAAALQELLGGKYGEMSTLGNYMFQSFNFRSKDKLRPFYSLVASITAEELAHVELVSNGVAMLNNGPDKPQGDKGDGGDISKTPFEAMQDIRLASAFLSNGGGSTPVNANGVSWNNDFVTTTGNLISTCCIISISNAAHACTSCGFTRRSAIRPDAKSAATCWCAARCMPIPMHWH